MNVIFVSESEGKSHQTVRRILDRYALRIGQHTWEASLSLEGLSTVQSLLRQKRSRSLCVACHRITQYGQREWLWTIGNKDRFSGRGHLASGWSARSLPPTDSQLVGYLPVLQRVISIAGLCHDLGKSLALFQRMLRDRSARDVLRHEWLSVEILMLIVAEPATETVQENQRWQYPATDQLALEKLLTFIQRDDRHDWLCQRLVALGRSFQIEWLTEHSKKHLLNQAHVEKTPLLASLLWLMCSHHQLPPQKTFRVKDTSLLATNYIKPNPNTKRPNWGTVFAIEHQGTPWQNESWLMRLRQDCEGLLPHVPNLPSAWLDWVRLYGRFVLQFADHGISSWACAEQRNIDNSLCYANTERATGKLAQRLPRHLLDVSRHACRAIEQLPKMRSHLPSVDTTALAIRSTKNTPAAFLWQDEAVKKLKTRLQEIQSTQAAFFGVLLAGTGSGKTIAAPRLLATLSNTIRLTYTSPTRKLSLQAGQTFQRFQLAEDQYANIIGDNLLQKLYQLGLETEYEPSVTGEEQEEPQIWVVGGDVNEDIAESYPLLKKLSSHEHRLLATPIISATLDTVMRMADGRRGNHVLQGLRLLSSDLIIDEVDHYSPEDLIAIGRLLEQAGFWRVNVIISSATLSPAIARGLYRAWQTGFDYRNQLEKTHQPVFVGWFSNLQPASLHKINTVDEFVKHHSVFVNALVSQITHEPCKRTVSVTKGFFELKASWETDFTQWAAAMLSLHHTTHFVDPVTKKRVSIGCVQVVNVKSCQKLAKLLVTQATQAEFTLKVVCLHARMTLAVRHLIENRLDSMLARHCGDAAVLTDPAVREAIDQSPSQDVLIVVVSTMESTGRDHDFDWGILETRQFATLIQFAGRMRRHRPYLEQKRQCLMVVDRPFRFWQEKTTSQSIHQDKVQYAESFTRFGINDPIPHIHATLPKIAYPYQNLLPRALRQHSNELVVDNASAIDEASFSMDELDETYTDSLVKLEQHRYHLCLWGKPNASEGLPMWIHARESLFRCCRGHADKYRFRRNQFGVEYLFWQELDGTWCATEAKIEGKNGVGSPVSRVDNITEIIELNHAKAWLFTPPSEVDLRDMGEKLGLTSQLLAYRLNSLRSSVRPETRNLSYHPLLGLVF